MGRRMTGRWGVSRSGYGRGVLGGQNDSSLPASTVTGGHRHWRAAVEMGSPVPDSSTSMAATLLAQPPCPHTTSSPIRITNLEINDAAQSLTFRQFLYATRSLIQHRESCNISTPLRLTSISG